MNNEFSMYHPAVNFTYFFAVIIFSMMYMHPVFLLISLVASFTYSILLGGIKAVKFNFIFALPMILVIALINAYFNHEGATPILYINELPITVEAIAYGVASAVMISTTIVWFSCYNKVLDSEKFIYLFGKTIPSIALILSMTLGFVPKFKNQLNIIRTAQRNLGRDVTNGNMIQKIKHGASILSILVTWGLENGVETADSMRSRGYGLRNRTNFSLYKFERRDFVALASIITLSIITLVGFFMGRNTIVFYPWIYIKPIVFIDLLMYLSFASLVFIPVIIEINGRIRWRSYK